MYAKLNIVLDSYQTDRQQQSDYYKTRIGNTIAQISAVAGLCLDDEHIGRQHQRQNKVADILMEFS